MHRRTGLRSPRSLVKERRRRARQVTLIALLSLGGVVGLIVLFNMSYFRLNRIQIAGVEGAVAEEIGRVGERELAGAYLGIIPKSHPFFYPKGAMAKRILGQFPEFAGVAVSSQGAGALLVSVTERQPVALWCEREECLYLDATGVAFREAPGEAEGLYYTLTSSEEPSPAFPGTPVVEADRLKTLLAFLTELEDLGLFPTTAHLLADTEIEVGLRNGSRLLIQETDGYETALRRLRLLLREPGLVPRQGETNDLGVDYIDLRYGNKVYFKPR